MNRSILLLVLLIVISFPCHYCLRTESKKCKPSGKLTGKKPPHGRCNTENDSDCCKRGKHYETHTCSPPITHHTKAILTLNGFGRGEDGGSPAECDGKFHSDDTPVVALSTGWFNKQKMCHKNITIRARGRRVSAIVVDECDSTAGCDKEHDFQPPCPNNIVDASRAVWKHLGVPKHDWGELHVTWSVT
ncbi:hypothetical protein Sjap_020852 [Stephania japonica]|uniref:Ripening-related protein 1 n=1 Tax=Stephania japonica TaxID=461633 RepID=A0AAP0F8T7_9MAGN